MWHAELEALRFLSNCWNMCRPANFNSLIALQNVKELYNYWIFDQLGSMYLLKVKMSLLIEICWHLLKLGAHTVTPRVKQKAILCMYWWWWGGGGVAHRWIDWCTKKICVWEKKISSLKNRYMHFLKKKMEIPSTVIHSIYHFAFGIIFSYSFLSFSLFMLDFIAIFIAHC